ncbi:hypothetical protein [Pseudosulfitobacter sp. SM2401]|uniref:hypothetical protein n=1 Tax=Pseudosulfitobacter sp. SM2401 TaxID=3350098 RepID=UPI0036F3E622
MSRVAENIGVETKIFKTSLTEMGVNFSHLEKAFLEDDLELGEEVRLKRFCMRLIPVARLGAAKLRIKFGDLSEIENLSFKMIDYQEANIGVVYNPDEYGREHLFR